MASSLKLIGDLKTGRYALDAANDYEKGVPNVRLPTDRLFPVELLPTEDRKNYERLTEKVYPKRSQEEIKKAMVDLNSSLKSNKTLK